MRLNGGFTSGSAAGTESQRRESLIFNQ